MSRLRVINLGLPKSGTTTLGKALEASGLKVADWKIHDHQTEIKELRNDFVGRLLYRGYFKKGDPLHFMHEFDAFTEISMIARGFNEWPQTDWGLLSTIIDKHPGAKFLYSSRPPEKLVDSMLRWSNLGKRRLPMYQVPGMPEGYGYEVGELIRWIDGHQKFCRQVFAGTDRFLEYDITDPEAPQKISEFLGMEIKWWGKANVQAERIAEKTAAGKKS
ncbi:sulfotransferase [Tropicibacter sp. Alg240-R139]|uniref:sulfotransferase n=1 Tax=Tropicibacter sp. Alg240-R139 TaxID=2305991 RepID=UPI0013DEC164|nr:sulfotransferase [Tropicibacter sp. Alg240-R139]